MTSLGTGAQRAMPPSHRETPAKSRLGLLLDTLGRYTPLALPMDCVLGNVGPHFYRHEAVIVCQAKAVEGDPIRAVTEDGEEVFLRLVGVDWQDVSVGSQPTAQEWLNTLIQDRPPKVERLTMDRDSAILALVWSDTLNLNFELVRRGFVRVRRERRFGDLYAELESAEALARAD